MNLDSNTLIWLIPVALFAAFYVFNRLSQVSPDEAKRLVKEEGARLVDVRSEAEYGGGHLPGSINLPLQQLDGKASKLGAKDKPVVVYCLSGTRSALARAKLKGLGFTRVFDLGPMSRW